jgi:Ala-tRNA(Pro) deacylase
MAVAVTVKEFLEEQGADYEVVSHPRTGSALRTAEAAHIPGDLLIKAVLLGDDTGYLLALLPATRRLDTERIRTLTGRALDLIEEDEVARAFADCEPGSVPPFGERYGIDTVVDTSLDRSGDVYFESGDHTELVRMSADTFKRLLGGPQRLGLSEHL